MSGIKQTEPEIEKSILSYLNMLPNVFAWKCKTMGTYDRKINKYRTLSGFSIRGVSDILGVISPLGIIIAIEVKTPKGLDRHYKALQKNSFTKETQHAMEQHEFILQINKSGGCAGFATSIDDVQNIIGDFL